MELQCKNSSNIACLKLLFRSQEFQYSFVLLAAQQSNHSANLKKMCLENYNRFTQYTQILQNSSDPRDQKFTKLQVQIEKLDMLKREQYVDSESNLKEEIVGLLQSLEEHDQGTIVDDDIDIKEEFIAGSEDKEFYLKQVKYKMASDNEQSSESSSCEADNPPSVNEANTADTDNVNATCNTDAGGGAHTRKSYKCYICNKEFTRKFTLVGHLKQHAAIRNLICSVCEKKFVRKFTLTQHMKIHEGIQDHKCSVCDKKFIQKSALTRHMKIHVGIRDHKCSVSEKSALTRHMKIHVGIRDHKCSVSDKEFIRKSNLTQHMKIHVGIRDYKCSVCDEKFTQKSGLTKHMKIHV